MEAESIYEVETILERRVLSKRGQKTTEYKVRWKGYDSHEDTWEPTDALDCEELLKAFNEEHPETTGR